MGCVGDLPRHDNRDEASWGGVDRTVPRLYMAELILKHFTGVQSGSNHSRIFSMDNSFDFRKLGFIGLGAMGKPMLMHLATKLPRESQIYVFDVVEEAMDEVCKGFPSKVFKSTSAKNVAEQVV